MEHAGGRIGVDDLLLAVITECAGKDADLLSKKVDTGSNTKMKGISGSLLAFTLHSLIFIDDHTSFPKLVTLLDEKADLNPLFKKHECEEVKTYESSGKRRQRRRQLTTPNYNLSFNHAGGINATTGIVDGGDF